VNKIGKVKFALLAAGALGGVLLLSGGVLDTLSLCLAGLAVWLLVLMALAYGNRLKLHQCFAFAERGALLAAQNAEQIRLLVARNADFDSKLRVLGKSVSDGQHLYLRGYAGMDRQISELQARSDRNTEILRAESETAFKEIWLALQVPLEGAPTNSYSEAEAASDLVPWDADQSLVSDGALVPMRTRPLGVAFASLAGLISVEGEKLLAEIGSTGGSLDQEIKALAKQSNGENERLAAEIDSASNSVQQEIRALAAHWLDENARLLKQVGSVGDVIERELRELAKQRMSDNTFIGEQVERELKGLAQHWQGENALVLEKVGSVGNVIERELQSLAKQRISDNAAVGEGLERELKALAQHWRDENAVLLEQVGAVGEVIERELRSLAKQRISDNASIGESLERELKTLAQHWRAENALLLEQVGSVTDVIESELQTLAKQRISDNASIGEGVERELKALAQHWREENALLLEQVGSVSDVIERELQALAKQRVSDNASIGEDIERELKALARQWQDGNARTGEQLGVCQDGLQHIQSVIEDSCKSVADFIQDDERLRDVTRRGMQWVKYETVQEVESLMQLNKLFPETADISLLGGWAMDPAAMLAVLKMILENKPEVIVECGSGTSTVWIAYALKRLGGGKLISLDHSVEYAEKTRLELKRLGLTEFADVRVGTLEEVEISGAKFTWYSVSVLEGIDSVDMLMVDGPPGASGELARYPAVPLLASSLRPSAYVIVDDAKRPMEKKIMNRWRREFKELGNPFWVASRTAALIWNQAV